MRIIMSIVCFTLFAMALMSAADPDRWWSSAMLLFCSLIIGIALYFGGGDDEN